MRPFLEASRHDPMHRRNKGIGSPGCRGVCYRCSGGTCAGRKALQHPPIPFLMEYSKNLYKRKLLLLTGYSTRLKTLSILPPYVLTLLFHNRTSHDLCSGDVAKQEYSQKKRLDHNYICPQFRPILNQSGKQNKEHKPARKVSAAAQQPRERIVCDQITKSIC